MSPYATKVRVLEPAHDAEAEEQIAALCVSDAEECLATIRGTGLSPEHFYDSRRAWIYQAACAVTDAGIEADNVTVAGWLADQGQLEQVGGRAELARLLTVAITTKNATHHASTVIAKAALRDDVMQAKAKLASLQNGHQPDDSDVLRFLGSRRAFPEPPGPAAFEGFVGEFLSLVEPCVETGPESLLAMFLAVFSGVIGAGPHFVVGATHHPPRLYALVVGRTGESRKGDGWAVVRESFKRADGTWEGPVSGLSSGEGLIARFADPVKDDKDRHG